MNKHDTKLRGAPELTELSDSGASVVARALYVHGVRRIFGVMGDGNLAWLSLWAEFPGVDYVSARHEASAVAMADGYAIESWGLSVSTVTHGPGLLNAMNALCTAVANRRPQLLIVGSTPEDQPFHIQKYDHEGLVASTGAAYRSIKKASEVEAALAAAISEAVSRNIVVVVDFSHEALEGAANIQTAVSVALGSCPVPSDAEIARAADILRKARNPLILGGVGAELSGAVDEAIALAELCDGVLVSTLAVRGLFAGNKRYAGVFGGLASPASLELFAASDAIVAIGTRLSDYTTQNGRLLRDKTLIQVDLDSEAFSRQQDVSVALHGDASDTISRLVQYIKKNNPVSDRSVSPDFATGGNTAPGFTDATDETGIDPRTAMLALDRWLPDNRVIVVDGGHFIEWPARYLRAPRRGSFRTAVAGGSIGLATAQIIGMAANRAEKAYAAVMGDGCYFMSFNDVETAVRLRIPVVLIVINDGAYSAEVHKLRSLKLPSELAVFENAADIAESARGLGADAMCISTPSDLLALPDIRELKGPLVIDIHVTPSVISARSANRAVKA